MKQSSAATELPEVGNQPEQVGVMLLRLIAHHVEMQQWDMRAEGSLVGAAAKDKTEEAGSRAPAGDVSNT